MRVTARVPARVFARPASGAPVAASSRVGGGGSLAFARRRPAPLAPPRVPSRARRHPPPHRRARILAASVPANTEWPPADVWEDFRAAFAGRWAGRCVTVGPDGAPLARADVRGGKDAFDADTRAVADAGPPGGIDDVDDVTARFQTLAPPTPETDTAECDDVSEEETSRILGGGQMGKMMIVQGDYAHGPLVLPECVEGARAVFEFALCARPPPKPPKPRGGPIDVAEVKSRSATDASDEEEDDSERPDRRLRFRVVVEAEPGAKRDWRAKTIEVCEEARVVGDSGATKATKATRGSGGASGTVEEEEEEEEEAAATSASALDAGSVRAREAAARRTLTSASVGGVSRAPRLGEDEIAAGHWRAVQGVTFLTCESTLDDLAFEEMREEMRREARRRRGDGEGERGGAGDEGDEGKARGVAAAAAKRKKVGRGRVKRRTKTSRGEEKGADEEKAESESESAAVEGDAREASSDPSSDPSSDSEDPPLPPPSGLVVVPTWAVRAKAPFSSAHEYVVGGRSPLTLLPMRAWCLVESINGELLVEVGAYCGEGGSARTGGGTQTRRRGGRASRGASRRGGTSEGGGSRARSSWRRAG